MAGVSNCEKYISILRCNMVVLLVGKKKVKSTQQNRNALYHNKKGRDDVQR